MEFGIEMPGMCGPRDFDPLHDVNEKIDVFLTEQRKLLSETVIDIVALAAAGAREEQESPDERLEFEVSYDAIEGQLEWLEKLAGKLDIEKLAEFIDAHPAVDYCDIHNTGVTLYFNEPKVLEAFGLFPPENAMKPPSM